MFPVSPVAPLPLPVSQAGFYFQNWGFSVSDAQKPLTITIALILFLALVSAAVTLYRRARGSGTAGFSIHEPTKIQDILNEALQQRATHELRFQDESAQRTSFACSPTDIDPAVGITLEVSGFIKPQPSWVGRRVVCYFKIAGQRKETKWLFFSFATTIIDIASPQAIQRIVLAIPDQLDRKQRRDHLRLDPPSEDIPELQIWPETLSNLHRPEDDPPLLEYLVTQQENPLRVLNISAGGLLLELRPPLPKALGADLEKGHRFYIRLVLRDPEQGSAQTYQLLTQVRNVFIDPTHGKRLIGLSFVAHLPVTEGSRRWKSLDGKGVEEIEDWVFKRHLGLYREKGLV
ncbi:c-di-GMP-binding flagellar brake protein YcgR, contains PilZNR and PilZ domains [Desulfonatronum zhilinae]|nr:c-di-GMP-binding flagellar brake protein YcgR, contains PilZNR and PilZ domains [Desulfonatronum zhilinae]